MNTTTQKQTLPTVPIIGAMAVTATAGGRDSSEHYAKLVKGWREERETLVLRMTRSWLGGRTTGYTTDLRRLVRLETGLATGTNERLYLEGTSDVIEQDSYAMAGAVVRAYLADHGAAVSASDLFEGRRFVLATTKSDDDKPQKRSLWHRLFGRK